MAGGIGFEPMHVGIKIRCLNQLGEPPTKDGEPNYLPGQTRWIVSCSQALPL